VSVRGQRGGWSWTSAIGLGLAARVRARARSLDDAARWQRTTASVQRAQLRRLLERASGTAFGREHDFGRLATLPEAELLGAYRSAVPPRDYVALLPYVERMVDRAEPDVLWPGLVGRFAKTSGTTAGDKHIPVSEAMMASNYRASLDIFANALRWGVSLGRLFGGRALFLGGSSDLTRTPNGLLVGDLSGIATQQIRWPLSAVYSPGRRVALLDHWPTKIEEMARVAAAQDIRMISGMPSWTVALFERVLALRGERGDPARTIANVWPNLTLFTHGGVRYDPFEPTIRRLFSGGDRDIPVRLELYPASEGFVAIQDTPGQRGMRLNADHGNFFEFVPLEDADRDDPPAFAADEAEVGQRYVVVMSTCAGLWRYVIGDVVEFESVPDRLGGGGGSGPARLRIVGRHKLFMNAFGENLIVENIEDAASRAAVEAGVEIGEFTAAPVYPESGRGPGLELAVEADGLAGEVLERFRSAFDARLQASCNDYRSKRTDDLGMGPPTITPLRPGSIHAWMESRGKLGGQHKVPRCANHREFLDGLLGSVRPVA